MSRRRSNRVRNTKAVIAPPASVTIIEDIEEDEYENHRSCWKHIAYLNTRDSKPKLTEEEFEMFKVTAPCFYEECTRRERSRRRVKCKYLVSKLRKKLNSNIFINYLEVLWKKDVLDEKKNSFVYVDCLWFSMYKSENERVRSSVFESIKAKHIFSKEYVFLPIVYWSHWTLLIFCNFGEDLDDDNDKTCMLFLDSLKTTETAQRLEPDIRKFVLDIFRIEGRSEDSSLVDDIPLHAPDVPQQTNDVECGSFVLYYIHRFIEKACSFNIDSYPCFLKEDWFSHKDLEDFCNTFDSSGAIR
ncbi:probable ubiquitin-like-specific protease 2A isoform X2 [Brassica rapa]|uniref:probable ubiquitin-like-specific protease 2A isoform X2 n=1 Tax=Brassica campestris TaxID=3711 RepID=UPI0004F1A9A1|nr:probable ubiquitin-like-specific protease 2A isoform X2 [Brassica rapa]XP_022567716.2 probable ubiquitin-like-specific protease 2A isoform X2 [Brassica napus]